MKTPRRWTRFILPTVSVSALLVAGGLAFAQTEGDATDLAAASLTVSTTSIKGMAGNKLIIMAKGDSAAGRLCITIPSNDYSLPATTLSEPPVPWDPCGPETPDAVLADESVFLIVQVRVPDTRSDLARTDQTIELRGDTSIIIDGSKISASEQ